jgi:hypothetical protein
MIPFLFFTLFIIYLRLTFLVTLALEPLPNLAVFSSQPP